MEGGLVDRASIARGALVLAIATTACGAPHVALHEAPQAGALRTDRAVLDAWIDRELAPHVPAAVIGIVTQGGVTWQRAVGSRDGRGGPPPDARSVFRIGSLTKLVTAIAIAQLVERGTLDLDAPVARWVPELAPSLARDGVGVTLRHLLTHTSGIAPVGDGSTSYSGATAPSEAALLGALGGELRSTPGTTYLYSNAGLALAGLVVARASGAPYRDYAQREILDPLGMRGARWDRAAVDDSVRAAGMGIGGDVDPPTWQLGAFEPAGALWTSLDDLAELARFALGAHDDVLATPARTRMLADDPLPGPHGLAWETRLRGERRTVGHLGSTTDYAAAIEVWPDGGVAVVALSSGGQDVLLGCLASALIDSLATSEPLASCAAVVPPRLEREVFEAALARLVAFLAAPTEVGASGAFGASFLEAIPPPQLVESAHAWIVAHGVCTGLSIATTGHDGGRGVLRCASGDVPVSFQLEREPPHALTALVPDP
jgi:CubicO group peptidase (beta-lactamase class C family)